MQPSVRPTSDFAAVYRTNHGFVWRTLRYLGVEPARLDDAVQDTFLVVHRRLAEFAGRAALRTWLFQIARRVASHYRRSAVREAARRGSLAEAEAVASPVGGVEQVESAELVRMFLDELDHDKAVVFVLAELEQWQAPEIAAELAVNLNTVYSRLRAARRQLERLVRRLDARERRGERRSGAQVLGALLLVVPPPPPPWRPGPIGEPSVLADMVVGAWPIEPVRTTVSLAVAGGNTVAGLTVVGASLAAVLVFAPDPGPPAAAAPPAVATRRSEPSRLAAAAPAVAPVIAARPLEPAVTDAPPPIPASRRRAASDSTLADELALMESLRAALLAADAPTALLLAERHRRRFPGGLFVEEAAAAAIEARCLVGERERARSEAAAFLARWPASALAARVSAQCGS